MSDGAIVTADGLSRILRQLLPHQQASWIKLLTFAATSTGSAYIAYLIFTRSRSRSCSKLNGYVKKSAPVYSRARTDLDPGVDDEAPWGDPLEMPVGVASGSAGLYDYPDGPWPRGPSSLRRRRDSLTSNATLVTKRSPSELMLCGMDALRRCIRFFEETRNQLVLTDDAFGSASRENSADSELEFILCKARQLCDDVELYYRESLMISSTSSNKVPNVQAVNDDSGTSETDNTPLEIPSPVASINASHTSNNVLSISSPACSILRSSSNLSIATTLTMPFFDVEPNNHFFKLYTCALEELDSILTPRTDRSLQLRCEDYDEFLAKVHCIRRAFELILKNSENVNWFTQIGQDILGIVLKHSPRDPTSCLEAYSDLIKFSTDSDNKDKIATEIAHRKIPSASFYDLVIDYMILESFDDLDNPPSAVTSVANNRWLSSGFRELALQTAVSAVLKHKRSKLPIKEGFFERFYNILDYISPILAWGFLGSDAELKLKVNLMKDSIMQVLTGYFSFDRVRYTSLDDLSDDILRITDEEYERLMKLLHASSV